MLLGDSYAQASGFYNFAYNLFQIAWLYYYYFHSCFYIQTVINIPLWNTFRIIEVNLLGGVNKLEIGRLLDD